MASTAASVSPPSRIRRFWRAARWPLLAFAAAVVLILAMTWPWCLHWRGEFLNHWDPPFHAWKLEFMARRILAGDIFCSSGGTGNTNMLYPQSGALYFEALQWPPALFAAGLFALTPLPSETIYHITLLLFWALSAPCMFLLLRELRCSRPSALAGSLVFCILPHRMSYCVEFQMELIFAMPLVYLFFLRFFRSRRALDAAGMAFSWWLLAVSELYEAVFVLMSLPVIALAFLSSKPRLLTERRFWLGGLAAAATGAVLLPAMLLPYLTQQGEGAVVRRMKEVLLHSAQPFSYLLPWGQFRPWRMNAFHDELCLYPTLAVLLAAAVAAAIWIRRDWASVRTASGVADSVVSNWRRVLRFVPPVLHALTPLFAFLFAVFLLHLLLEWHGWTKTFGGRTVFFLVACLSSLPLLLFVPRRGESSRTVFLRAFAVVAVLACVLSFGPRVTVGNPFGRFLTKFSNDFYVACRTDWLPFLANFRVVSRFGVLVLFFLVCCAVVATDLLSRRIRRLPAFVLPLILVGFCALESIPRKEWVRFYRPVDSMRDFPVVQRLLAERPPCTLAAVPVESRELEGMRMFSLLKDDFPYVYVWGGYFSPFAEEIAGSFVHNERDLWHSDLASIYPDVLVLADHFVHWKISLRHQPYEPGETVGDEKESWIVVDRWLDPVTIPVAEDTRYSLCVLRPLPSAPSAIKRVRSDVALLNPILDATAVFDEPAAAQPVDLFLNDRLYGSFPPDDSGIVRIRLDLSSLPRDTWSKSIPNRFEFVAGDGSPDAPAFRLDDFSLLTPDGLYRDPCTGRDLDPAAFPSPDAPWK